MYESWDVEIILPIFEAIFILRAIDDNVTYRVLYTFDVYVYICRVCVCLFCQIHDGLIVWVILCLLLTSNAWADETSKLKFGISGSWGSSSWGRARRGHLIIESWVIFCSVYLLETGVHSLPAGCVYPFRANRRRTTDSRRHRICCPELVMQTWEGWLFLIEENPS